MLFITLLIGWYLNENSETELAFIILIIGTIIKSDVLLFLGALMILIKTEKYELISFIALIIFVSDHKDKIPMVLILLAIFFYLYNDNRFFPDMLNLLPIFK